MAQRKDDTPSVATYADHEVITPPHELRKVVAPAAEDDDDPIARAEAALVELSSEFAAWMQSECERLETARQDVKRRGITETDARNAVSRRPRHQGRGRDIRLSRRPPASPKACVGCSNTPRRSAVSRSQLVDQHVDAVRAITREYARPDLADVAGALTLRLRDVTDEFLKRENSFRPDYLETIFSPPLAPGRCRHLIAD